MKSEVILVETIETYLEAYKAFLDSDKVLAFDTETTGLQVRSGYHDRGRTVQFSWRPWNVAYVFEMTDRWKTPIESFFAQAEELIAFNAKFDLHVMETYLKRSPWDYFGYWQVHDVHLVAHLHDERDKLRLKDLAVKYLSADAADEQTKLKRVMNKYGWDWATVPVSYLIEYGGNDAIITGQLFDLLHPRIGYALDAYQREQRLTPVLYRMERAGLLVDVDLLRSLADEERLAVERAEAEVQAMAHGLNLNAPHQVKAAFRDRNIELPDTKAETLAALDDPLAKAILNYRDHFKTLSTYIEPWLDLVTPAGRIHPNFRSLGTITGRMSSSDPNFQNISKGHDLRRVFIAERGSQMVVADWNQMELRLYAHFAEDENMRAAFISGDDIYQQAADLLGVPRQVGKMMMLASIYGAGPRKIAEQAVAMAFKFGNADLVPELRSYDWRELYKRFHANYRIKALGRSCELAARRREMLGDPYIRTLGGRRMRPKLITLPEVKGARQVIPSYKDLSNSLVQGSSADLMKEALIAIDDLGFGMYLRLTVHDEVVLEVPEAILPEVLDAVRKAMTRNEFVPPLTIGIDYAPNYGAAK